MLAGADEDNWGVRSGNGGDGATARGVSVGFGDDDGAEVGGFFKGFGLGLGLLADGCIQDHDGLIGLDGGLDLGHFVEEVLFLAMPARGVNDDDLEALFFEFGNTFCGDLGGVCGGERAEVGDFGFGGILFELVEGAGAEGIGADEAGFEAPGTVVAGEFGAGGGFAGALETDEHDDVGFSFFGLEGLGVGINELDEFVKDSLLNETLFVDGGGEVFEWD